ncbi:MAG: LysR family transcriptional regulator [Pigmentiphaga sp.]|uniref:LysR family transcriptional regulator n=1 Tax=Pigmentiphaga sp. TaxID=1977564 RepID=UPI0029B8C3C8|nr:LysR family transcriptional regulator [Pigmentiphaga sp.]MDX3907283.1 LysR family transcriptional regulator [Pigmentiphaga sp.]
MFFEDLSAFIAVAERGSFSRAAVELCIAQSALSKRVRRLEQRTGAALLERRARGVVLTPVGQVFLQRALALVDEANYLERHLSSAIQTPAGEVSIALPRRSAGLIAPRIVERCRLEIPRVRLQLLEGTAANVHGWMVRGEADVGLTYNPDLGTGFRVLPFMSERLVLFSSPGLAHQHFGLDGPPRACAVQDLARLPLILPRKPDVVRVLVERLAAGHGFRPNIVFEADGLSTIRGMVEYGQGMALLSLSTSWNYSVEQGRLVSVPFSSPSVSWKLHLAHSLKADGSAAVSRVFDIVRREAISLLDAGAWPCAERLLPDPGIGQEEDGAMTDR